MSAGGCHTCGKTERVEACLFCGFSYCSLHRGELGGSVACAGCLEAEHERKQAAKRKREAREQKRAAAKARREGAPEPSEEALPPPPLPEPPKVGPLSYALFAAAPTAAYLWFFLGWLGPRHELPGWVTPAGTALGALVAFVGVWAIAKTRLAPERPQ